MFSPCTLTFIEFFEFTKIFLLSETHPRPIGDPSETDMPVRRPIGDLDMLHRRPIGERPAPSETDMPD